MHGSTGGGWKRNASASPRQLPTQPTSPRDVRPVSEQTTTNLWCRTDDWRRFDDKRCLDEQSLAYRRRTCLDRVPGHGSTGGVQRYELLGSVQPHAAAAAAAKLAGTNVGVTEKEFSIALDKTSFSPGTYTFAIKNQGQYPHNLKISGPGVSSAASPIMTGGKAGSLTVTLQKGGIPALVRRARSQGEGNAHHDQGRVTGA